MNDEASTTGQTPVDTPYHRRLEAGSVYDGAPMVAHPSPSFESLTLLPLAEMAEPEAPRGGMDGECWHCTPNDLWIWSDEHWHLSAMPDTGMPFFGVLAPNDHVLLDTAPEGVLTTLGGVLQRVSRAVKLVPGVARLHYARFNDGNAHWHQQLVARPTGLMQARGAMSYLWADTLPPLPAQMHDDHVRIIATAMAQDGGTIHLPG